MSTHDQRTVCPCGNGDPIEDEERLSHEPKESRSPTPSSNRSTLTDAGRKGSVPPAGGPGGPLNHRTKEVTVWLAKHRTAERTLGNPKSRTWDEALGGDVGVSALDIDELSSSSPHQRKKKHGEFANTPGMNRKNSDDSNS